MSIRKMSVGKTSTKGKRIRNDETTALTSLSGKESVEEPASKGKLTTVEKEEKGNVKWDVYWYYLGAIGIAFIVGTILFSIGFQGKQKIMSISKQHFTQF